MANGCRLDEGVEQVDAVFAGGGEVGTQVAEVFGSGEGAHAAGDFLADFDHADFASAALLANGHRRMSWVKSR